MSNPSSLFPFARWWRKPVFSRGFFALSLAGGLLLSSAQDALAQEPPPASRYVVLTNDGSRIEGELVERIVGNHVTIKIATGEFRTIQAADIKAEWRPGSGGEPPPGGPPPVVINPALPVIGLTNVPLAYHGPDEVQIHLTNANNESGTLYREGTSGWEVVCQMPCTTTVDPKLMYKLHNSDPFRFPAGQRSLDMVADIGSRRRNAGLGLGLVLTGGIVAATALPLILTGMFESGWPTTPPSQSTQSSNNTAAWVTGAVCGAMVLAGIVILVVGPSTTLTTTSGQRIAKRPGIPFTKSISLTPSGLTF